MNSMGKSTSYVDDDNETMAQVGLIIGSLSLSMTIYAAIELGLFDIIGESSQQLTAAEVTAKLPVKDNPQASEMVDRILRLLAAHSVVSCSVVKERTWVYGLTSVARCFVKDEDDGVSLAPFLKGLTNKLGFQSWQKLKEVVLSGESAFKKAHGMELFEYAAIDQRFNQVFNAGMVNHTAFTMNKILGIYKGFAGIKQLVDVGGGLGHNLRTILSKHPNIKGINFDLPHVVNCSNCLIPGMEHVAGDMFESIPSTDAIFMKWILHDWDDQLCIKLLKNCYNAIEDNGRVIVVEHIMSEVPETTNAEKVRCAMDLGLMAHMPGGKERTQEEYIALAKAAGFTRIKFECYVCNFCVMEFYK